MEQQEQQQQQEGEEEEAVLVLVATVQVEVQGRERLPALAPAALLARALLAPRLAGRTGRMPSLPQRRRRTSRRIRTRTLMPRPRRQRRRRRGMVASGSMLGTRHEILRDDDLDVAGRYLFFCCCC